MEPTNFTAKARRIGNADVFVAKPGRQWIEESINTPDPRKLCSSLWYEGELCCFFAPSNMGKSLFAVQLGMKIAKELDETVLYFDFEQSSKQFEARYTNREARTIYNIPDKFVRVKFSDFMAYGDFDQLIADIEALTVRMNSHIIIIDNLSWLLNDSEKGKDAGDLMKLLCELKARRGLSMLVLAHTPKRDPWMPLTQDSLAGSKRLANFMDSIFAMGKDYSEGDDCSRYIKQVKVRYGMMEYGAASVARYRIVQSPDMVGMAYVGPGNEHELLKGAMSDGAAAAAEEMETIRRMSAEGATQRRIAEAIGRSAAYVNRRKAADKGA
ncbi:MAG: AAA family ATPase [Muribaculaceae bacterium]|nr:AAA family ATPase [Muribaculaceae bacterium]